MLRRAMGKKKAEEMAEHRAIFRAGAAKNDISEAKADEVFDLMEKFAGYGFNKSHAAAYSLLAYHTAWLKVHYTAEFFAANMTVEMDNTDKLKVLHADALSFGIAFEAPDVNRGTYRFEPISNKIVRYGLGAIKGTGEQAIEAMVAARQEGGPFTSLFDFCQRVDKSKANKRTVEALIKAGAFDNLERNRAALIASVDTAFEFAANTHANALQTGLFDMFDEGDAHGSGLQAPDLPPTSPWGIKEQLMQEKTAIGYFLSGHLFDQSEKEVRQMARTPLGQLAESRDTVLLAGIVTDLRVINGQRGKVCLFKIDDKTGTLEASVDDATHQRHRDMLQDDELVLLQGTVQNDRFSGGLRFKVQQIFDLAGARSQFARHLVVRINHPDARQATQLTQWVQTHAPAASVFEPDDPATEPSPKGLPVQLVLRWADKQCEWQISPKTRVAPTEAALNELQLHFPQSELVYFGQ
jgi:DNA polymerase-3 subunit alpha